MTTSSATVAESTVNREHAETIERIVANVGRVIIGKDDAIRLGVVALLSRGHTLVEDVPGVGKTMLARSLAITTGCDFKRLQFTPDLLPSDVTGASVYNQQIGQFEYRPGPVMAQVVLADEINRATPKTQSALLEAMGEQQVTVEGVTHLLPSPFTVIATQNPIEYEGTFPLPEAQLDRFFMRISLGYPDPREEVSIMDGREATDPIDLLQPSCTPAEVVALQQYADSIYIDELIKQYIVEIANATRSHPDTTLGVSPRASINLMKGAKAFAMLQGRDYVIPDDVKAIAVPVMSHRVLLSPSARMRGINQSTIVNEALDQISVPGAAGGRIAAAVTA
ncbi:MAG: MoxR family ATPase [Chloroflexi bacterium]|nr:MoxR family ATPase [Chloroflexota bacterium]